MDYVKHAGTSEASVSFVNVAFNPLAAGNRLVAVGGTLGPNNVAAWPFAMSSTPDPASTWVPRYSNENIAAQLTGLAIWDAVADDTSLHTFTLTRTPGGSNMHMFLWVWELLPSDFVIVHDALNSVAAEWQPHASPAFGSGGEAQHIAAICSQNNRDFQNLEDPIPWNRRLETAGGSYFRRWAFHDLKANFITATDAQIRSLINFSSQAVVVLYRAGAPAPGPTQDSPIEPADQEEGQSWAYDLSQHFTSSGGVLVFSDLTGAPAGITLVNEQLVCDGTTVAGDYTDAMTVRVTDDNGFIVSDPFGLIITPVAAGTVTTEPLQDGNENQPLGLSDGTVTIESDAVPSLELARFQNVDQLPNGRITVQDAALTPGQTVYLTYRFPGSANKEHGSGYYTVA